MFTHKIALGVVLAAATTNLCQAQNSWGGGAQASASTSIRLHGYAVPVCSLSTPAPTGSATNASYSSNVVQIGQFIDPATAYVLPASLSLQFANALCNSNATLSLSSKHGGMTQRSGATMAAGSGAFLNIVPYTATANWGHRFDHAGHAQRKFDLDSGRRSDCGAFDAHI